MLSYQPITVENQGLLIVGTARNGKYFVYLLKPNGKMTYWVASQASFYGLNGFLANIGPLGGTIREQLELGRLFTSSVPLHSLESTLTEICSKCMIQTLRG